MASTPGFKNISETLHAGKQTRFDYNKRKRSSREPVAKITESKVLYYTTNGILSDIIHNINLTIGHGGRN